MWPAGNEEFIEIVTTRRRQDAIILATLLSGIGIRTAGEGPSIEVPKDDFGRALDRLRTAAGTGFDVTESRAEAGRTADREKAEQWLQELGRYRIDAVLWSAPDASTYSVSVRPEEIERSRMLLRTAGLASEEELVPPPYRPLVPARRPSLFQRIFRPIP